MEIEIRTYGVVLGFTLGYARKLFNPILDSQIENDMEIVFIWVPKKCFATSTPQTRASQVSLGYTRVLIWGIEIAIFLVIAAAEPCPLHLESLGHLPCLPPCPGSLQEVLRGCKQRGPCIATALWSG